MNSYQVSGGVLKLPAGTVMHLTKEQLATREHAVSVIGKGGKGAAAKVKARQILQFVSGEVVHLEQAAEPVMLRVLHPLSDPKADADKRAADEAATLARAEADEARAAEIAAARAKLDEARKAHDDAVKTAEAVAATVAEAQKVLDAADQALDDALKAEHDAQAARDALDEDAKPEDIEAADKALKDAGEKADAALAARDAAQAGFTPGSLANAAVQLAQTASALQAADEAVAALTVA